jgi:hypothetical protein
MGDRRQHGLTSNAHQRGLSGWTTVSTPAAIPYDEDGEGAGDLQHRCSRLGRLGGLAGGRILVDADATTGAVTMAGGLLERAGRFRFAPLIYQGTCS